jgi:Protein of unknown function (DUF3592)
MERISLAAVVGGIFSLIGAGLLVFAVKHFIRRLTFIRSSTVVAGLMVGLREERDGMEAQSFRYPRIRFRTASGREITVESGMALSGAAWRIGERVSVRYPPDYPERAELDSLVALWGPTVLFALLAVVFVSVGIGVWFGFMPE